jgi:nickel transport protein
MLRAATAAASATKATTTAASTTAVATAATAAAMATAANAAAMATAALVLLLPLQAWQPARAHAIQSTLEPLRQAASAAGRPLGTGDLQLSSAFSSGLPASDAAVKLVSPDGATSIALGRTDASGRLNINLPEGSHTGWEVMVDAGPGHRDYLELPGTAGGAHANAKPLTPLWHDLRAASPLAGLSLLGLLAISGVGRQLLRRR